LLALVRHAREAIADASGVPAPELKVTVHPTRESFGRATGHIPFVAGATRGTRIDFLPLSELGHGSELERVVRHEVAHAVVDRELAGRALWVREGAASYFARLVAPDTNPGTLDLGPVPCPSDFELRQPASPAALSNAYRRAETCFRRVVANGIAWRNVH